LAGVAAAGLGVVGTVSYSSSPGVILVSRVASRYAQAMCGVILLLAAFMPRLNALLTAVPATVVGSALCVALGSQVGAGISVITAGGKSLAGRDYLVVGLPVIIGTLVATLPSSFFAILPGSIGVVVSNGLVVGIVLVLLLEHLLLRKGQGGG
jgi:xanthine/uracil permease